MTERVREILNWYGSDNPGTLTNCCLTILTEVLRVGIYVPVHKGLAFNKPASVGNAPSTT